MISWWYHAYLHVLYPPNAKKNLQEIANLINGLLYKLQPESLKATKGGYSIGWDAPPATQSPPGLLRRKLPFEALKLRIRRSRRKHPRQWYREGGTGVVFFFSSIPKWTCNVRSKKSLLLWVGSNFSAICPIVIIRDFHDSSSALHGFSCHILWPLWVVAGSCWWLTWKLGQSDII